MGTVSGAGGGGGVGMGLSSMPAKVLLTHSSALGGAVPQ